MGVEYQICATVPYRKGIRHEQHTKVQDCILHNVFLLLWKWSKYPSIARTVMILAVDGFNFRAPTDN